MTRNYDEWLEELREFHEEDDVSDCEEIELIKADMEVDREIDERD